MISFLPCIAQNFNCVIDDPDDDNDGIPDEDDDDDDDEGEL